MDGFVNKIVLCGDEDADRHASQIRERIFPDLSTANTPLTFSTLLHDPATPSKWAGVGILCRLIVDRCATPHV